MNPNVTDLNSLRQVAEAGDPAARYVLGHLLLDGRQVRAAPLHGVRWIEAAAELHYPPALQLLAVFSAVGFHRALDWHEAMELVGRAAEQGDAMAREQLQLLGSPETFNLAALTAPPPLQHIFERPRVAVIKAFLAPAWCDWIIARSKPMLQGTEIYRTDGVRADESRTNTAAGFPIYRSDLVLAMTNARVAATIGVPLANQETTNVLHYEPGQEFLPHYDFLDPAVSSAARELQISGQRIVTFLVYLNDTYEGGETDFPRLKWRFKGKKGDALVFWNISPEGAPEMDSQHAGLPTTTGEKWLLSKWVRQRSVSLL